MLRSKPRGDLGVTFGTRSLPSELDETRISPSTDSAGYSVRCLDIKRGMTGWVSNALYRIGFGLHGGRAGLILSCLHPPLHPGTPPLAGLRPKTKHQRGSRHYPEVLLPLLLVRWPDLLDSGAFFVPILLVSTPMAPPTQRTHDVMLPTALPAGSIAHQDIQVTLMILDALPDTVWVALYGDDAPSRQAESSRSNRRSRERKSLLKAPYFLTITCAAPSGTPCPWVWVDSHLVVPCSIFWLLLQVLTPFLAMATDTTFRRTSRSLYLNAGKSMRFYCTLVYEIIIYICTSQCSSSPPWISRCANLSLIPGPGLTQSRLHLGGLPIL